MNHILIITDTIKSFAFLDQLTTQPSNNHYDVFTPNKNIHRSYRSHNEQSSKTFRFITFDFLESKIKKMLTKNFYTHIVILTKTKDQTSHLITTITKLDQKIKISLLDRWNLDLSHYPNITAIQAQDVLNNHLISTIPSIPVTAKHIGNGEQEIIQITVPLQSKYIYRHLSTLRQKNISIAAIYRNKQLILPSSFSMIHPNDRLLAIGNPATLQSLYKAINNITQTLGNLQKLYVLLDLGITTTQTAFKLLKKSKALSKIHHFDRIIVNVINPTHIGVINELKTMEDDTLDIRVHYKKNSLLSDIKKSGTNLILTSPGSFQNYKKVFHHLGISILTSLSEQIPPNAFIVPDTHSYHLYESVSSTALHFCSLFDLSMQCFVQQDVQKEHKLQDLMEHYINICKTFKKDLNTTPTHKNPIRHILQDLPQDMIGMQVLPMSKEIVDTTFLQSIISRRFDLAYRRLSTHCDQLFVA